MFRSRVGRAWRDKIKPDQDSPGGVVVLSLNGRVNDQHRVILAVICGMVTFEPGSSPL